MIGPIGTSSPHGIGTTVDRVSAALARRGIAPFATIDHAAGARGAGLVLRVAFRDPHELADGRTLLSWVRPALSLIAAAVAVVELVPPFALPGVREAAGVLLAGAGLLASDLGSYRYRTVRRTMRRGGPLPTGGALLLVPASVAVVGTLVLVTALLGSTPPRGSP
jgi:putative membrane protein